MKKTIWLYIAVGLLLVVIILYFTGILGIKPGKVTTFTEQQSNSQSAIPENLVFVEGGSFINKESSFFGRNVSLSDFYIGKYEITQKEWIDVMGSNPSEFKGDSLPAERVTWYECIEYCNKRSEKEDLQTYYEIDKNKKDPGNISEFDSLKWMVTIRPGANGYRLPTEAEWEYAASGGRRSMGYEYSGSNDIEEVAWYWRNSGDTILSGGWLWKAIEYNNNKTKPIGTKNPNELGIYDMSGNVREWCWDWYRGEDFDSGILRVQRGGGWLGGEHTCVPTYRGKFEPNGIGPDQGFRVCRSVL